MTKEITVDTSAVYDPRALAELVGLANEFSSKIMIDMEGRCINVKSIMGVMGLGLDCGKVVTIDAQGEDAKAAIMAIAAALTN